MKEIMTPYGIFVKSLSPSLLNTTLMMQKYGIEERNIVSK